MAIIYQRHSWWLHTFQFTPTFGIGIVLDPRQWCYARDRWREWSAR